MAAERKEFDSILQVILGAKNLRHVTSQLKSLRCNLAAPNPLHAPPIRGVPNRCVHHWHLVFASSQIVVDQTRPEIMANNLKQTFDLLYQLYHGWSLGFLYISWLLSIAPRRRSRRRFEFVCEGDAESCSDSTHPTATNFCQRNLVSHTFFKETKFDVKPHLFCLLLS